MVEKKQRLIEQPCVACNMHAGHNVCMVYACEAAFSVCADVLIFLFLSSCCDTTINLIGICDDLLTFCRRLPLCVSLHTAELSSKCVYVLSPFFRLKIGKRPDLLRLPFFASHTALAWVCVCVCLRMRQDWNRLNQFHVY